MFLGAGYDEVEGNGLRNMALHRKLCLGIMSTELDKISSSDEGPAVIEKFYHKHKDHGVTYFFNSTKPDLTLPVYRDHTSMAYYLTRKSVRLSIRSVSATKVKKVLLPVTSWLTNEHLVKYRSLERGRDPVFAE